MKILVTGADGYIGSVLTPLLLRSGHEVVGLDAGFYRRGWLFEDGCDRPPVRFGDTRRAAEGDLSGFEAVIHLAELSNDPLGEQDPKITFDINHRGSVRLAELAKAAGVRRFVYASSCSVYGAGNDDARTEVSEVNPQTAYAQCKVLVERDVGKLADDRFTPTFLRNATAFGASPRMRFDIVLNNLSGLAWTTGSIKLISDGTPWRPLAHVQDIAQAMMLVLQAPREAVHNEIFNVGDEEQNYRIRDLAEIIARTFPGCAIELGGDASDNRSYRVSFDKIHRHLPDFRCRWSAERGARQLHDLFRRVDLTEEMFRYPPFTRLQQLRYLLQSAQIDGDFFWQEASYPEPAEQPEAAVEQRSAAAL